MTMTRSPIKPGDDDVLAVIDVQNCFVPGGTLPVPEGDKIIPIINSLGGTFRHVVITQDWHTPGHISFASSHPGKSRSRRCSSRTARRSCRPDHGIQGTPDADPPAQGSEDPARRADHPQGLPPAHRLVLGVSRGGPHDDDGADRLSA